MKDHSKKQDKKIILYYSLQLISYQRSLHQCQHFILSKYITKKMALRILQRKLHKD